MTRFLLRIRQFLLSVALGAAVVSTISIAGLWPQSAAQAQYVVAAEFRIALSPHGRWLHHSSWGEVWTPDPVPSDWRPYTRGRWLYTEEWGWYWQTADEEAAWGWVTNHYGRWVHDHDLGWLWVPGEDWGPAWVDWRHGSDYVGWAPLPPDNIFVGYRDDPLYWSFVRPRYLLAPRLFVYFAPRRDRSVILRRTVIVNRTVIVDRDRQGDRNRDHARNPDRGRNPDNNRDQGRARHAVNPGVDPGIIAKAIGKPIRAAKIEPAVLRGTKVEGTREVDAGQGKRARATVRETNTVIRPADNVGAPRELAADEKGRLGDRPLKATRNAEGESSDRRSGETGRSSPVTAIRGGSSEAGRAASRPLPPPATSNRRREDDARVRQSLPLSPPVARRAPPTAAMRAGAPPSVAYQHRAQEQRANRQNGRQQDDRPRSR